MISMYMFCYRFVRRVVTVSIDSNPIEFSEASIWWSPDTSKLTTKQNVQNHSVASPKHTQIQIKEIKPKKKHKTNEDLLIVIIKRRNRMM